MKRIEGLIGVAQSLILILTVGAAAGQASVPSHVSGLQITTQVTDTAPGSLYMVEVGPFPDGDRAAAIAKELVARGFSQAKAVDQTNFRVVSDPLPRSAAAERAAALAGRGFPSQMEPSGGDTVQLVFGSFSSQQEADALARRIGAAGYDARVRGGTGYTVQVGAYPLSSVVDAIVIVTNFVKARAPEASVTTSPAPPQAIAAPPVPQAPPAPAISAPAPQAPTPPARPAPAPQSPPARPAPAPSFSGPLHLLEVGPFPDRDRAAAMARELSDRGFSQTKVIDQTKFRVVSEPLPRSVAEGLVATLAGRGFRSEIEVLGGDTVHLVFGAFSTQQEAEALAHRIGATGYDAWVRGGAGYSLEVGPYPQSAINTITGIVKTRAPQATVTAASVSAQAPALAPVAVPQSPPTPAISVPAPQTPPVPPAPSPSLAGPLHVVEIGSFPNRDRAAAIAKELSARGFSQTKVVDQTRFRVVSEPLPRSVAEGLVATLAGRGFRSEIEALGGDTVHLVFGTFSTQPEAEALAHRIGATGYDAWVRGGAGYALEVGPYPQTAINTITGIVKARAPEVTVRVDSMSAQGPAPAPAAVLAPQAPPPSPVAAPQAPPVSTPPAAAQGPQGPVGTPSPPAVSRPPQPAAPAPSQAASGGRAQAASWGLSQGTVTTPTRAVTPVSPSTLEANPFLIVPAQSLGTVRLGMPVRDETARLGASKGSAGLGDGTMMYRWFEPPSNSGIGVRTAQNGMVVRVWVLNDERYRTKEGLHVGSTEAEVRAALGNPTAIDISVQDKTRTLVYESLGLWFSIQLDGQYKYYNAVFDIGVMAKR